MMQTCPSCNGARTNYLGYPCDYCGQTGMVPEPETTVTKIGPCAGVFCGIRENCAHYHLHAYGRQSAFQMAFPTDHSMRQIPFEADISYRLKACEFYEEAK